LIYKADFISAARGTVRRPCSGRGAGRTRRNGLTQLILARKGTLRFQKKVASGGQRLALIQVFFFRALASMIYERAELISHGGV
jgi:hypothetical protein